MVCNRAIYSVYGITVFLMFTERRVGGVIIVIIVVTVVIIVFTHFIYLSPMIIVVGEGPLSRDLLLPPSPLREVGGVLVVQTMIWNGGEK